MLIGSNLGDENSSPPAVQHRPLMPVATQVVIALVPESLREDITQQLLVWRDSDAGACRPCSCW